MDLGFRGLGVQGLGFRVWRFRGLEVWRFRGLEFWVEGFE